MLVALNIENEVIFMKNKKNQKAILNDGALENVQGGVGGPIMKTCPKCGNAYKAGNAGVNYSKYSLKEMCDECAMKAQ